MLDDEAIALLKTTPLLSAVDEASLNLFLQECSTRRCRRGEVIFTAGEPAEQFYVVLAGRVKVYQLSPRGDEQILHLCAAGESFGEAALWADIPYPACAQAVEPVRLLIVRRDALRRLLVRCDGLAMGMLAGLSAKLHEFSRLIEDLSLREVPQRLARVLLAQAAAAGSDSFRLRQTKRQLAAQIGTVAETLSRALATLKDGGLIHVSGSQIRIRDKAGLEALAQSG